VTERIEKFEENHLDECARLAVATFNAEPWNEVWTFDTAKRELVWTMGVPGFVGLVSLDGGAWPSPRDTKRRTIGGRSSSSERSA
jgi:hypothetical protein